LDRCALFVDAGYALGDGALAVHGTRHRDSVSWDHAGLLKLLGGLASDRTGLPLLRCYWYDVATAGSRAAEHEGLADLPGVRLRLSKARPSRREGVEAEMRKDLMALARNHAVTDVIIVSAEEDLAPAVAEVQEFGVRTVLLTIGADASTAGSRALRQECDDVIEVSPSHLRPFVELIAGAEPQFSGAGYRDQRVSSSALQPASDAAGPRLYASPGPAGYERAAALAAAGGPSEDHRDLAASDAAGFGAARHLDGGHPASVHRAPDVQQLQHPQPAQQQHPQPAPAAHYPQPAETLGAGVPAGPEAGYGQTSFTGPSATPVANGHGDGGQHGLTPYIPPGQASMGTPGVMGNGLTQPGLPGPAGAGLPAPGLPAAGGQANGMPANGIPGGVPGYAVEAAGGQAVAPDGLASSGPGQPGPAGGHFGPSSNGLSQPQGLPAAGPGMSGQHLVPPPQQGLGQQTPPPQMQQGMVPQGPVQSGTVQPGQNLVPQPGAHRHASGLSGSQGQSGPHPLDPQRPQLPARQLPAGNGQPYGQDQRMPYAGQLPQHAGQLPQQQFAAPVGQQPYAPGGYPGQPAQLSVPPSSVGDAVQSAHAEGFGFGEAVARDAPALWLEAVLARKPRMPSDLEARLLQGSALPIDSLLHDEVRHALRRGFWDALERSRH
jgi:NYN domain